MLSLLLHWATEDFKDHPETAWMAKVIITSNPHEYFQAKSYVEVFWMKFKLSESTGES